MRESDAGGGRRGQELGVSRSARQRARADPLALAALGAAAAPASRRSPSKSRASAARTTTSRTPDGARRTSRYVRLAPARYADGAGAMAAGPNPRYVSNRIFNPRGVGPVLPPQRQPVGAGSGASSSTTPSAAPKRAAKKPPIPFKLSDPLESFSDTLGSIPFARNAVAPGHRARVRATPASRSTGPLLHRQLGPLRRRAAQRLEWMRIGPDNGEPAARRRRAAAAQEVPARSPARVATLAGARDAPKGRSPAHRRTRSSRATCGPTRTSS